MAQARDLDSGQDTLPAAPLAPTVARAPGEPSSQPAPVDPGEAPLDDAGFHERYATRHLLGAGGMGEVYLVKDARVGREVAIKVARKADGSRGDAVARFAREARVQGQLEHPAVVPVYDLGRRPDGAVYFTMKRVRGVTLEQVLSGLRAGDVSLAERFTRRKLLTAFVQVCQAIDFAHARGVLHRDLKPANVMLGDFGEVYVLDWGLAKMTGDHDEPAPEARAATPSLEKIEVRSGAGATTSGAVLGTPGYMAPEQLRGEIDRLDAKTDVYALGAILFEILTWQPLHPREDIARAMTSTLEGADARCTRRAPDREVPPELEAACVRATAMSPRERFAGVRDLHLAVERYLDGDRDLARRRELAAEWAAQAEAATEKALKAGAGEAARREALEHAGRALALDPHHTAAMGALVKLLLAPPKELPPEVVKELDAAESRTVREAAVRGGLTYLSWILFAPLLWVVGVRSLTPILAWFGCIGLTGVVSFLGGRWVKPTAALHFVTFGLSSVGIMAMAALWGPFVMVPALATANTIAYVVSSKREWAVPTLLIGALTVVVPVLASVAGWMPQMVSFDGDTMITHAWALHMPAQASLFILTFAMVTIVVVSGLYLRRVRSLLASAERALHVQSWHLRQLIPQEAREAILPPGEEVSPLLACPINGRPEKA